jgi:hypothetical protein
MLELEGLLGNDTADLAKNYYLLANGFYNITYFGNSWGALVYERNFYDYEPDIYATLDKEIYDCSTAQEYYVKAMSAAKNVEFAAECCFMASKCEQNAFYVELANEGINNDSEYSKLRGKYRSFFRILKNKYTGTMFYKKAIEECKYFAEFVKN